MLGLPIYASLPEKVEDMKGGSVLATCVFCSVPDPVLGLKEILRVTKPGGQALFIEHVRSEKLLLGALMDLVNPLVVRIMGPNINRQTVQNVRSAGLRISEIENLGMGGIFKLIAAQKPADREGV